MLSYLKRLFEKQRNAALIEDRVLLSCKKEEEAEIAAGKVRHQLTYESEGGEWKGISPYQFMDQKLEVVLSTGDTRNPSLQSVLLLDKILKMMPQVLEVAEKELREFESDEKMEDIIEKPRIWITDEQEEEPDSDDYSEVPNLWSIVIERNDWEGFGWHIDFDGDQLLDAWAGD